MYRLGLMGCCTAILACGVDETANEYHIVRVGADLANCKFEDTTLDSRGRVRLAANASGFVTHGTIVCDFAIKPKRFITSVLLHEPDAPKGQSQTLSPLWPMLASDIITQVRIRDSHGDYGPWEPSNVLD